MPHINTQTDAAREAGHTPGPWTAKKDIRHSENRGIITDGPFNWAVYGKMSVANMQESSPWRSEDEVAANARLIAAAPDMLEALVAVEKAGRISYAHLCCVQQRTPEEREAERMHVATVWQKAIAVIERATGASLNTQPSTLN